MLDRPTSSARYIWWVIELSKFYLCFQVRTLYKGYVLADFLAELTRSPSTHKTVWKLWTDGSVASTGVGIGLKVVGPIGQTQHAIRLAFLATNNVAEYEALLYGLHIAWADGALMVRIYTDSLLIVQKVKKIFQVKEP